MATECPDCGSWSSSTKCACGYVFKASAGPSSSIPCYQCGTITAVTRDDTGPLCEPCFAAKPVKPHNPADFSQYGNRAWAYKLIARHDAGERISGTALKMAQEVAA